MLLVAVTVGLVVFLGGHYECEGRFCIQCDTLWVGDCENVDRLNLTSLKECSIDYEQFCIYLKRKEKNSDIMKYSRKCSGDIREALRVSTGCASKQELMQYSNLNKKKLENYEEYVLCFCSSNYCNEGDPTKSLGPMSLPQATKLGSVVQPTVILNVVTLVILLFWATFTIF